MTDRQAAFDRATAMGEVARLVQEIEDLRGQLEIATKLAWRTGASATDLGELLGESRQTITRRLGQR